MTKCFNAIFANWKRAYWTVEQATALTFGKEPTLVTSAYVIQECVGPSIFAHYYKLLRDRILKAQADGRLQELIAHACISNGQMKIVFRFRTSLRRKLSAEQDSTVDDYKWFIGWRLKTTPDFGRKIRRLNLKFDNSKIPLCRGGSHPIP